MSTFTCWSCGKESGFRHPAPDPEIVVMELKVIPELRGNEERRYRCESCGATNAVSLDARQWSKLEDDDDD